VRPSRLGERCLVTPELTEGVLHLLGMVRRRATGADGRQYIGLEYASMGPADTRRLRTFVERYEAGGT
jgi:hypothetical protein